MIIVRGMSCPYTDPNLTSQGQDFQWKVEQSKGLVVCNGLVSRTFGPAYQSCSSLLLTVSWGMIRKIMEIYIEYQCLITYMLPNLSYLRIKVILHILSTNFWLLLYY